MTVGKQLGELFGLTYWVIRHNLQGVDHQVSLQRPKVDGNCINWVLGHILHSRDRMLRLLSQEPVWEETTSSRYARGRPQLQPDEPVEQLGTMIELLELSQERLLQALEDEEILSRETAKGSLGTELFTFNFHESYHAGQLGLLRRIAGMEGSVP